MAGMDLTEPTTTDEGRTRPTAGRLVSYGLELAFLVVLLNLMLLTAGELRWWNLVFIAVAMRFGIAVAIRLYRLPDENSG